MWWVVLGAALIIAALQLAPLPKRGRPWAKQIVVVCTAVCLVGLPILVLGFFLFGALLYSVCVTLFLFFAVLDAFGRWLGGNRPFNLDRFGTGSSSSGA